MTSIHSTATIGPHADIGDDVVIGPYAILEDDVVIGGGTRIDTQVRVLAGTTIGERCHLHHGVCIGGTPQSVSFDPSIRTSVEIGSDTVFREFSTVHRATTESYTTRIGNGCLLQAYSHVPHDAQIGNRVTLENFVQLAGHTHIDDDTVLRGGIAIHQFTHIGTCCDLAAGVSKDVPPFLCYDRYRLSNEHSLRVNEDVLRARGYTDADIDSIRLVYAILYDSGLNVSKAVEEITARFPENVHARVVTSFIAKTKRGLVSGRIL